MACTRGFGARVRSVLAAEAPREEIERKPSSVSATAPENAQVGSRCHASEAARIFRQTSLEEQASEGQNVEILGNHVGFQGKSPH
jgi:hypothetical protein